jgi:hypothetical protein
LRRRKEMECGREKGNFAILDEAAEKLRAAGYQVNVQKELRQREGEHPEHCVEILLQGRKYLSNDLYNVPGMSEAEIRELRGDRPR